MFFISRFLKPQITFSCHNYNFLFFILPFYHRYYINFIKTSKDIGICKTSFEGKLIKRFIGNRRPCYFP